jgi:hypothetical protein
MRATDPKTFPSTDCGDIYAPSARCVKENTGYSHYPKQGWLGYDEPTVRVSAVEHSPMAIPGGFFRNRAESIHVDD